MKIRIFFINMTEKESSPINEFTTAGYLTMSYPTLFIDGTGDITVKKDRI